MPIDVPATDPGHDAEITVPITMRGEPGEVCRVEWKMVDETGASAFPNGRPILFLLYAS